VSDYRVNELFWSIQGEGVQAGRTAVFIRLQGCPVGCAWCDSKLTWYAGGSRMSAEEIVYRVSELPRSELLIITGGEPLIQPLDHLIDLLRLRFNRGITIETSGVYPFKGGSRPDWLTVSPKRAAAWALDPEILASADELKYVVDAEFDLKPVYRHLVQRSELSGGDPEDYARFHIVLMPEGDPPKAENVAKTLDLLR